MKKEKSNKGVKRKSKQNLDVKILRLNAGYNMRSKFIEDLNLYLEKEKISHRVSPVSYANYEMGSKKTISLEDAYYISKFLKCSIQVFIN